jgi:hypothetical protein
MDSRDFLEQIALSKHEIKGEWFERGEIGRAHV